MHLSAEKEQAVTTREGVEQQMKPNQRHEAGLSYEQ
jgi:hypothetical protein